jgi:hypothetical protein
MVTRQYVFMALERLQVGSKIRVTEKGMLFQSVKHAKTFTVEKGFFGRLIVSFNGVRYELNRETNELMPYGEYGPYEGIQGALWE